MRNWLKQFSSGQLKDCGLEPGGFFDRLGTNFLRILAFTVHYINNLGISTL